MHDDDVKQTLGVLIETEQRVGCEYIVVRVYRREEGGSHPLGISFGIFNEFRELADLSLDGFVSDMSSTFIGPQIEYRNVFSVDLPRAKAMAKVLRKVQDRLQKDN